MALIYFYDATELDKQQLTDGLKDTDHHWEYVEGKIEPGNCDPDTEVISVFVTSTVTREIIEKLPRLKLIACRSTGFNNVDLAAAEEHGVMVANVPTYGEETVAEYAFTLLLALTRKLPEVLDSENERFTPQELCGIDLAGKVFGVIGTGHIGQKALKIAHGFSMQTIAYDAYPDKKLEDDYHFTYVGLDELLARADIVSLHVPLLPATRHMINQERIAAMKHGAILVNTARGELVDTKALIEALDSGKLAGAAIDVVEGESLLSYQEETALLRSDVLPESVLRHSVEISALQKMPNVIVSPHNAFNTTEAIGRINQTTAQNIIKFWYGETPNKVAKPQAAMGKLLITRHTESEWNKTGRWTGTRDAHLSDKGFKDATLLGQELKRLDLMVDVAFCSQQFRSRETLESMLNASQQFNVKIVTSGAINERDYGEYTGKNKWQMKEEVGEETFDAIRRGWDVPIPGGETLKDVYARSLPFYLETVLPLLKEGKNVLLVAHGNSIRSLMKYIEDISEQDIAETEMIFGTIVVYDVDSDGHVVKRQDHKIDTELPPA